MAIAATAQWDVRTGGSNTNGGAFDPGVTSPGTDYSQQNSPHITYTDLVIGATNTQLTSVLNPFNSTHVGNCIYITSSSGGFTVGWWEIKSVSGVIATMDRAVGTAASTGGNGNLGGSLATIYAPLIVATPLGYQPGNTVWVQSGTYTLTSTPTIAVNCSPLTIVGYGTTHGDNGTKPLMTTATNGVTFLSVGAFQAQFLFRNMSFSNTAATRSNWFNNITLNMSFQCIDCIFDGFLSAYSGSGALVLIYCVVKNSTGTGGAVGQISGPVNLTILDSVITGGAGAGINISDVEYLLIQRTLITGNAGAAVAISTEITGPCILSANTIAGNGADGLKVAVFTGSGNQRQLYTIQLENNIFYGNSGFGVNLVPVYPFPQPWNQSNAYGANTLGAQNNWPAGIGDVALSATPFTNSSAGDYSLNSNSGGGLLCAGAGYPGTFPGGTSTGVLDIGAVQTTGGGGRVVGPAPVFETVQATKGVAFSDTLSAVGGTSPYTYAVTSGSLPTGLSLVSGVVSGTPSATGTFSFTITATDTNGYIGSTPFQIIVSAPSGGAGGSYTFIA